MLVLLAALLVLHGVPTGRAQCLGATKTSNTTSPCEVLNWSEFSNYTLASLNLSSHGIGKISSSAQLAPSLQELDLSFNHLPGLPQDFLAQASALKQLHLQHNQLQELPPEFFKNAASLEALSLQGNPLPSVPASTFQLSLQHLVVDCRCDVALSVVQHCTCSPANCTAPSCLCLSPRDHRSINVTKFYAQECGGLGTLGSVAIAASVVAVLLLAGGLGGAFVLLRRKRKASEGHSKRASTASIGHGQPRYISRSAEPGPGQGSCQAGDYENIFIGPSQPARQYECLERRAPQYRVPDEDCYMESDACPGDLPIYCNTQQLYGGSYPLCHDPEDVYIVPDT